MTEKENQNVYDMQPVRGPVSAVRIFLWAGLALFPVVPIVLILIAYMQSDADSGMKSLFSVALLIVASVSAVFGIALLAVSGFMLLIRKVRSDDDDVAGSVVDSVTGTQERSALDLRAGWIPSLVVLFILDVFQTAAHIYPSVQTSNTATALLAVSGIADAAALLLFGFFWTAGVARLLRAGRSIPGAHYAWPVLAVILFFLPIILGD